MEISISEQLISCFVHFLLGIVSSVLYDAFRIIRIIFRSRTEVGSIAKLARVALLFLWDFVFCFLITLMFSVITFAYSYGWFRWFNLFGFGVGFIAYSLTLSRVIMFASEKLIVFIRTALGHFVKALFVPIKIVISAINVLLTFLYRISLGKIILKVKAKRLSIYFEATMQQLSMDVIF